MWTDKLVLMAKIGDATERTPMKFLYALFR